MASGLRSSGIRSMRTVIAVDVLRNFDVSDPPASSMPSGAEPARLHVLTMSKSEASSACSSRVASRPSSASTSERSVRSNAPSRSSGPSASSVVET